MEFHRLASSSSVSLLLVCAGFLFVPACQTPELPLTERERFFAAADNQENRVRVAVERYQHAQAKANEFEAETKRAEEKRTEMMKSMLTSGAECDRLKTELAALATESTRLHAEITASRERLVLAQQELAKVQAETTELDRGHLAELERKKELVGRLEDVKQKHEKSAERVDALLKEITAE